MDPPPGFRQTGIAGAPRLPYDAYVPIERYDGAIEDLAAALLAVLEDPLTRFAAARDPARHIIWPMLQPRIARQYATAALYEFNGRFAISSLAQVAGNRWFRILNGMLHHLFSNGMAPPFTGQLCSATLDDSWVLLQVPRGLVLARKMPIAA